MPDRELDVVVTQSKENVDSLEEGKLLDYITGKPVKDTPKEQVRQRIARARPRLR